MPSVRAKMVSGLFKMLGVNKMLDKQGEEFDKLLEKYKVKQKKQFNVPYKKMKDFNIDTESINGTTCYVISKKGATPKMQFCIYLAEAIFCRQIREILYFAGRWLRIVMPKYGSRYILWLRSTDWLKPCRAHYRYIEIC